MNLFPLLLLFYCCFIHSLLAQSYGYQLDLNHIQKDKLTVSLQVPDLKQEMLTFQLPALIPGTYGVVDFGRFVVKFEARDKEGKALPVKHPNLNTWIIKKATQLHTITYQVHDTWDTQLVFEPAGSNIEEDFFVLNNHCFFGFFKGYEDLPFRVEIEHPKALYGGTALKRIGGDEDTDIFETASYFELMDSPILYAEPDTATFRVGNTSFLVQTYANSQKKYASTFAPELKKVVEAQNQYLGGELLLEQYAFLFFMVEEGKYYNRALEHTHSSFYCLVEKEPTPLKYALRDIAAHEFFHTRTPLTIGSQLIHNFDFMTPKMSQHLWLYEGATEYASTHYLAQAGVLSIEDYLVDLSTKVKQMNWFDNSIAFTDLSKNSTGLGGQYGNVYVKGALINLCLDIQLRMLSEGQYGFQDMIRELSQQYNRKHPFEEDSLFTIISQMTAHPNEMRSFFRDYVEGSKPLPLEATMAQVGVIYVKEGMLRELSKYGFNPNEGLLFHQEQGKLELQEKGIDSFGKKVMGFQQGDLLHQWQGQELEFTTMKTILQDYEKTAKAGDWLTVTVLRKDDTGNYQPLELKGQLIAIKTTVQDAFMLNPYASPQQLALRKAWLQQ